MIPNFSLAGSVLSRNHVLATFVHERLEWSLVDQSPEQSETEWLCVDVAGYNIINVNKPPRSRFTPTAIPTFPHPSLYIGDLNCQHVVVSKFCSQHDLTKIPIKSDTEQKAYDKYAANDTKENVVSDCYETICMLKQQGNDLMINPWCNEQQNAQILQDELKCKQVYASTWKTGYEARLTGKLN